MLGKVGADLGLEIVRNGDFGAGIRGDRLFDNRPDALAACK
jgi:hypothetical protein